jgi:hypothetical protein
MNMDGKGFALQLSVSHVLLSPNVLEKSLLGYLFASL